MGRLNKTLIMKRNVLSRIMATLPFLSRTETAIIDVLRFTLNASTREAEVADNRLFIGDCIIPSCVIHCGVVYSVRSIAEKSFWWGSGLTSVTIPDTVTTIGKTAFFNCVNLKSVTFPDNIESIGPYAFNYCESLGNIYYGSSHPIVVDDRVFDSAIYSVATLHVAEAAETKIKETSPWMYFKKITVS